MIKNFVKYGNSWALAIGRPILDLLKLNPECPVEPTTDGTSIRMTAAGDTGRKEKLREVSRKVNMRLMNLFSMPSPESRDMRRYSE